MLMYLIVVLCCIEGKRKGETGGEGEEKEEEAEIESDQDNEDDDEESEVKRHILGGLTP